MIICHHQNSEYNSLQYSSLIFVVALIFVMFSPSRSLCLGVSSNSWPSDSNFFSRCPNEFILGGKMIDH